MDWISSDHMETPTDTHATVNGLCFRCVVRAVTKGIPHNYVELPPLVSVVATRVCIPIGNSEMLLAAVCKSPGHAWNDTDITKLLSFRHKSILAGDLNAKHPFWNALLKLKLLLKN
jgi:hypothetical protein